LAEAHYYLGGALARQKKSAEAVAHLNRAVNIKPVYAAAANDLAWLLATASDPAIHNAKEAVRWAERACELTTNRVAGYLDTLGAAYAGAGRFEDAIRVVQSAINLAAESGQPGLDALLRERLRLYQAGLPYREKPLFEP
jgi:tetratricopeptide (TPR) repeat protein